MPLRLYNTLTRQKEIFRPLQDKKVGLYCCGPTVYWYAHLGNLRAYLFEDILRRVLEYNGYRVKHVMNITDVGHLTSDADTGEDKIEKGARREGKTAKEIANFYTAVFKKDLVLLNIKEPTLYCRATDHIKEQIELVKILEKKGFVYKIDDGLYFDTSKLTEYGRLARLNLEGQKAGARVAQMPGKKHPTDFALWKFTPNGVRRQQEWNSPWSKGFPGWHLECSALSQKYLGKQFDIHCGGIDHISIHHTNEIAQSQAAYGEIPARFWLHGEFLLIDGKRMGKSEENFVTLEKLTKTFNPLSFRYLVLTAHYRSKLNLTWESLKAAQIALNNLYQVMQELNLTSERNWWLIKLTATFGLTSKVTKDVLKKIKQSEEQFLEAINDDLDMPKALSILWQVVGDKLIPAEPKQRLLLKFDRVLGLRLADVKPVAVPPEIKKLIQTREKYRQQHQWLKADILRAQIEQKGWLIEDTAAGPKLRPKS